MEGGEADRPNPGTSCILGLGLCALLFATGILPMWLIWLLLATVIVVGSAGWLVVLRRGTTTCRQEWTTPGPPAATLSQAERALRNMGATIVDQGSDRLVADVGRSLLSFGEQIEVRVHPADARTTWLSIASTSSMPTAVDYGKNRRNIRRVIKSLGPATLQPRSS